MRMLEPLRRLRWQLPLTIAAVLLAVVAAYAWVAYGELRRTTVEATEERLREVGRQLEGLLARQMAIRMAEAGEAARDSVLVAAVSAGRPIPASALTGLESLLPSDRRNGAVVVWDSGGALLHELRGPGGDTLPLGRTFPDWAVGGSAAVGPFFTSGEISWIEVAAPLRWSNRTVGYVVLSRRLAGSSPGAQLLADLIGRDAALLVGVPGGVWTDLVGVVEGPPLAAIQSTGHGEYRRAERGWRFGVGMPVAGTPWQVWVDLPRDGVLARTNAFLRGMIPLGGFIVVVGALAGWALTRRVTGGIRELTAASSAMAKGDYGRRVDVRRPEELGELSAAFNRMAERVEDAQQRLEQRVQERTSELLASQEQFSAITTTAQEAIVTADARGLITYFNPGAERTFGYPADEVVGQPLTILMPERYRAQHRSGFARFLASGESAVIGETLELVGLRRDGSEFPVELSLASWSRNGEPAFAGILRDVTRRREAEQRLERYASELQVVNEELEAFSYSVSHDLRAPLRSVHGFSQALMEDYRDRLEPEGLDYLRRVTSAVDRMGQLIDDMLRLAQASRTAMRHEAVDLSGMARGIAGGLREAAPDREVEFRIADGLAATGDARLLRQALENLIGNAWKFTAKVPRAAIEIGACPADNGERAFFVRDNGAGFDMAYAGKLFGAFQRLHAPSEFPGTGVGLALAQRIVHRHGGRIWAVGEEGRGATFHFTIPGQ